MSPYLVALCYSSALALALVLLWYFGPKHWYWHVLSVVAALALGMVPLPGPWSSPEATLAVGWVFLFLFTWGIAGPFFVLAHHPPFHGHHHPR